MNQQLDNFYLELVVTACQMGKDRIWMQGDLEIRFNSEGKPYTDSDIIDIFEFLDSLHSEGEFKIFSCCCGIPECSGWKRNPSKAYQSTIYRMDKSQQWQNMAFWKESLLKNLESVNEEVENYKTFFNEKGIDYVGYGY